MTTTEALQEAKALLMEKGWVQGREVDERGRHCTYGAIREVIGRVLHEDINAAVGYIARAASSRNIGCCPACAIAPWNDTPGRTFNEVMKAFDAAIILSKEDAASEKGQR